MLTRSLARGFWKHGIWEIHGGGRRSCLKLKLKLDSGAVVELEADTTINRSGVQVCLPHPLFLLPSQNNIAIFCLWVLYFLSYNLFVFGFIECDSEESWNFHGYFVLFGFGHVGLYLLVRLGVSITRFGAWVGLVLLRNGWRFYVFQRFV